jgi:hypothetical protein
MNILSGYFSLSVGNLVALALVSLTGLYLFQTFRSWYRLRHFKGPLLASLSRVWLVRAVTAGRLHLDFQAVNQKYGMFYNWPKNQSLTVHR